MKYFSAVVYNFPKGFHKTILQKFKEKLELLGNQQKQQHATDA